MLQDSQECVIVVATSLMHRHGGRFVYRDEILILEQYVDGWFAKHGNLLSNKSVHNFIALFQPVGKMHFITIHSDFATMDGLFIVLPSVSKEFLGVDLKERLVEPSLLGECDKFVFIRTHKTKPAFKVVMC